MESETVYEDAAMGAGGPGMMPDMDNDDDGSEQEFYDPLMDEFSVKDGGRIPLLKMTYINKTSPKPCDKQVTLYELNEERFYRDGKAMPIKGKLSYCHSSDCERPFSVNMIPHTNLIMIIADKTCPCFNTKISIEPTKVEYGPSNETDYCERLKYNIYRRKPMHCMNYHPEVLHKLKIKTCMYIFVSSFKETEIKLCGGGTRFDLNLMMLALILFVQRWITVSSTSVHHSS